MNSSGARTASWPSRTIVRASGGRATGSPRGCLSGLTQPRSRHGHVGVLVLDGGPGVFEGGDHPTAVLFGDLGLVMICALVFSVCMPTAGRRGGWGPRAGRAGCCLPAIPGLGFAEAPRARVGPKDALRGASGKDLGVPLRVEGGAVRCEAPPDRVPRGSSACKTLPDPPRPGTAARIMPSQRALAGLIGLPLTGVHRDFSC
jgi:hypothetical protein